MPQVQFQFTFQDYVHAQKLHSRRSQWSRFTQILFRFIFPALGGLGLLATADVLIHDGMGRSAFVLLCCSLLLASYPILLRLNWKYCYLRTRSDDGAWALDLDDDLIRANASNARSQVEWSAIRSSAEDKKMFLLYMAPAKFFPIPKRACTNTMIDELRELFKRRISP